MNYSSISPVFALGFTTERWGLEPFPGNLVAISGSLPHVQNSTSKVEKAWGLPYSCFGSVDSSFSSSFNASYYYDYYYQNGLWFDDNLSSITNISAWSNICTKPQACANSGCTILIEGIGRNTTGPANSHIVSLSHGISILLVLATTLGVLIMGCIFSRPEPDDGYRPGAPLYNPPPRPSGKGRCPDDASSTFANINKGKEVARCAGLLREMYELDILIWSTEGYVQEDVQNREDMKVRAEALFTEIRRIVNGWTGLHSRKWDTEEWEHVQEIRRIVDQHPGRRY